MHIIDGLLTNYSGGKQAAIVVNNIEHLVNEEPLENYEFTDNMGIHMTLGIVSSIPHLTIISSIRTYMLLGTGEERGIWKSACWNDRAFHKTYD